MDPATPTSPAVVDPIHDGLERLRAAARRYHLLVGVVRVVGVFVALLIGQLLLDRWLRLTTDQRFVLDLLVIAGTLVAIVRFLLPAAVTRLDDVRLARWVDRAHPDLHDGIATAIEFSQPGWSRESNSPALVNEVMQDVSEAARRLDFLSLLDHAGAKRRYRQLGIGALVLVVGGFIWSSSVGIWFQRNWLLRDVPWPQATYLRPVGFVEGVMPAPRGEPLQLQIENVGRVPRTARLLWTASDGTSGQEELAQIGAAGSGDVSARWEADLGPLRDELRFRLVGGDERSPEFVVRAIDRPAIVSLSTVITPPEYTGAPAATFEETTALELLRGSTIEVTAKLNKPVASAEMQQAGQAVGTSVLSAPDEVTWSWDAPESGPYQFALRDEHDWANRRPVRLMIKVRNDAPPEIALTLPGVGEVVTPQVQLAAQITARDAYGLRDVASWVQRNEDPEARLNDPLDDVVREHRVTLPVEMKELGLRPGDRLAVWATATDNDPSGPNVTEVTPIVLEVLSRQDFLAALGQREQGLRQEFERLLSAQRGVQDLLGRLVPELPPGSQPTPSQQQQIAGLVRRQAGHASRVLELSERFAEVLEEMQQNQVARAADERRIAEGIVTPLSELGQQALPNASSALESLQQSVTPPHVAEVSERQGEVLERMESVLANMLEWEGYREAVALLTELIEMQEEVRGATQTALEGQVDDILGLEEFFEPEDSPADDSETP